MTTVAAGKGNETPHAGAWLAVGHAIVEVPLMVAVFYGVGYVLNSHVQSVIAFVGGIFLLFMGVSMLRSIKQDAAGAGQYAGSPVMAGVLLSIGNPYFLIWWPLWGPLSCCVLAALAFGDLGLLLYFIGCVISCGAIFFRPFPIEEGSSLERDSSRLSFQSVECFCCSLVGDLLLMQHECCSPENL